MAAKFFRVLTHRLTFGKRGDVVNLDHLTGDETRALVAAGHIEPADDPEPKAAVAPEPSTPPVVTPPAVSLAAAPTPTDVPSGAPDNNKSEGA